VVVPDVVHDEGGVGVIGVSDVDLAAPHGAVRGRLDDGREALQRPSSLGESSADGLGLLVEPVLLRNSVGMQKRKKEG